MQNTTIPAPRRRAGALALAIAVLLAPAGAALAQQKTPEPGGGWNLSSNHLGVQQLSTPGIDRDWVELQDIKKMDAGEPVTRFAIAHTNKIAPSQYGTWDTPSAGVQRWRLELASKDATSINLGFSKFRLPQGAELTLLNGKGVSEFRSFTAADNDDHGQLWTPMVAGDTVTLVLTVPSAVAKQVQLEIGSINHGYRGLGEIPWFAKSGSCNVDVVCPEGDAWRDQIRSVAALTLNGVDQCTGALVNNVNNDMKPYFLTANHCSFGTAAGAAGMVAYWNFENSTCRAVGSGASGGPGDGTRTQFNTGAIARATRAASDFTLVEFDDPVDPDVNPYWSGIDARDVAPASAVAIHHPSVDEKRISFENDQTTITGYNSNTVTPTGTHIRIIDWDLGTTEGGSSGSPLYSPEKRIVGQLHGGGAACGNNLSDWYGRVAVSWAAGGTAATQLKDWLDPGNTGTLVIDGRGTAPFSLTLDPPVIEACTTIGSADVTVAVGQAVAGFDDDVTLSVSGLPAGATGTFDDAVVTPPGSAVLTIDNLTGVAGGNYTATVTGTDGVDTLQTGLTLALASGTPAAATLTSPADNATALSTSLTLTWQAVAGASSYQVQVDDNADFSSPVSDQTVTAPTAVVSGLAVETEYFWRVIASNGCGDSAASATFSFETGAQYCDVANAAIPDAAPTAGLVRTINIPTGGTIEDLRVGFNVTHTYMGDVRATLAHNGVTRAIIDRPGYTGTGFGCSGDNADIILDDAATLTAETNCTNTTPAYIPGESYRPNETLAQFDGQDLSGTWTLTVTDSAADDTGSLVSWCLLPQVEATGNLPPVAGTLDDVTVLVGDALAYDASTGFSDPDGDDLVYSATGLPAWATLDTGTGAITGTPTAADVGTSSVTVTVTEDTPDAGTASASFDLTVAQGNAAPVAGTIDDVDVAVGVALTLDAGVAFSDPNGDDLVFSAPDLPAWATIDPVTGEITGTPGPGDVGSTVVTVIATEDTADALTASTSFTLTVTGTAPGDLIFADGFEDVVIPD